MNHIRKELRRSLASIPEASLIDPALCREVVQFVQKQGAQRIGIYYPMVRWKELSLLFLEDAFAGDCAFPKVCNGQMSFHTAKSGELVPNPQIGDLLEPAGQEPAMIPQIVFAPATACDRHGHRIGKGGGYYDRYLNSHPECLAVGVVDDRCLHDTFDPEWIQSHDHTMAFVLTQTQLFQTKETSQ